MNSKCRPEPLIWSKPGSKVRTALWTAVSSVSRWNRVAEDRRLAARGVYDIVTRRVKQVSLGRRHPHDLGRAFLHISLIMAKI